MFRRRDEARVEAALQDVSIDAQGAVCVLERSREVVEGALDALRTDRDRLKAEIAEREKRLADTETALGAFEMVAGRLAGSLPQPAGEG